jgi:hypothetical protein
VYKLLDYCGKLVENTRICGKIVYKLCKTCGKSVEFNVNLWKNWGKLVNNLLETCGKLV